MPAMTSLLKRITPTDLEAYLSWNMTSGEVAKKYGTKPTYVTYCLPKRPPKPEEPSTRELRDTRNLFRDRLAKLLDQKMLTVEQAAKQANCSTRNIYRHLKKVRRDAC